MTPAWDKALRLAHKVIALQAAQEICGVAFDAEKARDLVEFIKKEQARIESECEPQLPPRKLKSAERHQYTIPARPFKKDGSHSEVFLKWLQKHGVEACNDNQILWIDKQFYKIEGGKELPATMPMKLGNQDDIKSWLLGQGWKPVYRNVKKGKDGKPVRENGKVVYTSAKLQEGGRICPNLELLQGDLVRHVIKWLSLRNRLSVLEGWLRDRRLAFDGRLTAGASGITNTGRLRHSTVVNVPKAEDNVLLGKEFRSLFIPSEGNVLVNYDAAALESRVAAHYTWQYDQGKFGRELLEGDIHSKNAKLFYPEETAGFDIDSAEFSKDDPRFKPYRSKSKNGFYCICYGGGPAKLAQTLGLPSARGSELYDRFWASNASLKKLRDAVERFWELNGKSYILGIDGRKIGTRNKNGVLNCLFQSAGAIVMDLSCAYMDKSLGSTVVSGLYPCYTYRRVEVKRVGYWHDELAWDCPPEVAEDIGKMGVESIRKAGRYLKLNVALDGEYKIGTSWAATH
jgi:DNA polymerase family A